MKEKPDSADKSADKAAEIFAGVQEREQEPSVIDKLYRHAIDCVDRVFQECKENPKPILPDFLGLGADKFEGVVKLAEKYRESESQITTLKQTITRLEGEKQTLEWQLHEAGQERNAEQESANRWREKTEKQNVAMGKIVHVAMSHGWDEGWTHGDLPTWLDSTLNELAPQPEVIEGRGQAVRLALCQAAENLADIGESLVSLSQSLRESPPRKPAFVAPEKPEQVLIRTQRGELYWATKADGDWWLAVGGGWHRNVKPIDPVTGEPIAKEEA